MPVVSFNIPPYHKKISVWMLSCVVNLSCNFQNDCRVGFPAVYRSFRYTVHSGIPVNRNHVYHCLPKQPRIPIYRKTSSEYRYTREHFSTFYTGMNGINYSYTVWKPIAGTCRQILLVYYTNCTDIRRQLRIPRNRSFVSPPNEISPIKIFISPDFSSEISLFCLSRNGKLIDFAILWNP